MTQSCLMTLHFRAHDHEASFENAALTVVVFSQSEMFHKVFNDAVSSSPLQVPLTARRDLNHLCFRVALLGNI